MPEDGGLLAGRTAVVTGGGAGIGGAISRAFAAAGARVVLAEIDAERAAGAVADIEAAGGVARAVVCDVREHDLVIVIPTLNEEGGIAATINSIKQNLDGKFNYKILVVDGSSTDKTVEIAKSLGAKIIK